MKTMKTAWNNRKVYVYENIMSKPDRIYAGMVDKETGYVFTEEDVRRLHAMDDAEVYNNRKNSKPKVQAWEEAGIEEWKKAHPDEDLPSKTVLSLEDLFENENGEGADEDKCGTLGRASMLAYQEKAVSPQVEAMREIVMEMGEKYWSIYALHIIEGRTFAEIALVLGIGTTTVKDHFKKITRRIESKLNVNL